MTNPPPPSSGRSDDSPPSAAIAQTQDAVDGLLDLAKPPPKTSVGAGTDPSLDRPPTSARAGCWHDPSAPPAAAAAAAASHRRRSDLAQVRRKKSPIGGGGGGGGEERRRAKDYPNRPPPAAAAAKPPTKRAERNNEPEQDDRWAVRLEELRKYKAEHGHWPHPDCWETRLEELRRCRGRYGHVNVPINWTENKPLARWVTHQRRQHRLRRRGEPSSMTDERASELETLGLVWERRGRGMRSTSSSPMSDWDMCFEDLKQYKGRYGLCDDVSSQNGSEKKQQMGVWICSQRRQYWLRKEGKEGMKTPMTDERVAALESIGFDWDGSNKERQKTGLSSAQGATTSSNGKHISAKEDRTINADEGSPVSGTSDNPRQKLTAIRTTASERAIKVSKRVWEENFEALCELKRLHGHCNVSGSTNKLGRWAAKQRAQYRRKKSGKSSALTEEREKMLDGIGFVWQNAEQTLSWEERFNELCEFKRLHGHCSVQLTADKLGVWVNNQRLHYRLKQGDNYSYLTDEQEEKLNGIGFVWNVKGN